MSKVLKHLRILLVVCIASWAMLFVMGHFIELHPDAYRDMTRSILMVYALILGIGAIYKLLCRVLPIQNYLTKANSTLTTATPLQVVSEVFLAITAVNSIMMLTGIDVPKQGVFAYIHMLTRLFIVTVSVVAFKWHEVKSQIKTLDLKSNTQDFLQNIHRNKVASAAQLFTLLTVLYCAMAILANQFVSVRGGAAFYQALLALMVLCFAVVYGFAGRDSTLKRH